MLDHTNYARSLTIHVFDVIFLPTVHPDIYQKKLKVFSSLAKKAFFSTNGIEPSPWVEQ